MKYNWYLETCPTPVQKLFQNNQEGGSHNLPVGIGLKLSKSQGEVVEFLRYINKYFLVLKDEWPPCILQNLTSWFGPIAIPILSKDNVEGFEWTLTILLK